MSQHTPGPWTVLDNNRDARRPGIVSACGTHIAVAFPYHPKGCSERASMDRIVACVNALEGIADPAALRAQHADLLAACEAMVSAWDAKSPLAWQPDEHRDCLNALRAAIARAKGA